MIKIYNVFGEMLMNCHIFMTFKLMTYDFSDVFQVKIMFFSFSDILKSKNKNLSKVVYYTRLGISNDFVNLWGIYEGEPQKWCTAYDF